MRKRRRSSIGFTIAEILIALMVISVAMLGTIAAIAFGLRASKLGGENTVAIQINRKVMELILQAQYSPGNALFAAQGNADADPWASPNWRPVFDPSVANWFVLKDYGYLSGSTPDAVKFIEDIKPFQLNVYCQRLPKAGDPDAANPLSVTQGFYQMTVTTRWQDKSRFKSVETTAYSVAGTGT